LLLHNFVRNAAYGLAALAAFAAVGVAAAERAAACGQDSSTIGPG
jgi:hypothetical protein